MQFAQLRKLTQLCVITQSYGNFTLEPLSAVSGPFTPRYFGSFQGVKNQKILGIPAGVRVGNLRRLGQGFV